MELGQGEIYFIAERDGFSNTGFIKIGLVRERDGRDSYDRIKEHQTGNPRTLQMLEYVKTVLVSTVENTLHREYAATRAEGEWFELDKSALDGAISRCKDLAASYATHVPTLTAAHALGAEQSAAGEVAATADNTDWQTQYLRAQLGNKLIDSVTDEFKAYLSGLYREGKDVGPFAKIKEQQGSKRFKQARFKEQFPNLWEQFTTEVSRPAGAFSVEKLSDVDLLDSDDLRELQALIVPLQEAIGSASSWQKVCETAHSKYLDLLSWEAYFDERLLVAGAYLKVACGKSEGIAGVCKWKRTIKTEIKFLSEAAKKAYPEEYEQSSALTASSTPVRIRRGSILETSSD